MKNKFFSLTFILTIFFVMTLSAQESKSKDVEVPDNVVFGDLKFLKSEKIINTEFVYDSMGVGKMTENEYIMQKVTELNNSQSGKGDKWLVDWNDRKKFNYPVAFMESFNKKLMKSGLVAEKNASAAKYTMVVKTLYFEAGFYLLGLDIAEASKVILEILFFESNNRSLPIATIFLVPASGGGGAPAMAYGAAGKIAGKYLVQNVFQNNK
ncbi:MAG: hypothetical protein WCK34_03675 [Bacteroidota bacterium]